MCANIRAAAASRRKQFNTMVDYKPLQLSRRIQVKEFCEFEQGVVRSRHRQSRLYPNAADWNRLANAIEFAELRLPSNTPSHAMIFDSPLPEFVHDLLNSKVTDRKRRQSQYFLPSFALNNLELDILCEAIVLFSSCPSELVPALMRFDWISLLTRVLDSTRGKAAQNSLRALSNLIEKSIERFDAIVSVEFFNYLMQYFHEAFDNSLKSLSLYCLSSVAAFGTNSEMTDPLFHLFSETMSNPSFWDISLRGLSFLSARQPVSQDMFAIFLKCLGTNDCVSHFCLFGIHNAIQGRAVQFASQLANQEVVNRFCRILGNHLSPRLIGTLTLMTSIVGSVPELQVLIAESPIIDDLHFFISEAPCNVRVPALEFLVVLLGAPLSFRKLILDREFFPLLVGLIDSVDPKLGVCLVDAIISVLRDMQVSERDRFLDEFQVLFGSLSPGSDDLDRSLAVLMSILWPDCI
jgi:hypothetical protein